MLHRKGFERFDGEPVSDLDCTLVAAEVGRYVVFAKSLPNRSAQRRCFWFPSQERQHHRRGEDGPERICNALPGYVWRGAVHWLKQRSLARVNVSRRRKAQAACQLRAQVADDVSE